MHTSAMLVRSAAIAAVTLAASQAAAQDIADTLQVGVLTSLLTYTSGSSEDDATGVETDITSLEWGIGENLALEGGYALSEMFIVGGLFSFHGSRDTTEVGGAMQQEAESFTLFIGPKLDVMFERPNSSWRPFAGLIAGYTTTSTEIAGTDASRGGFEARLRGGVRWFPMSGFSFDPQVAVGWATTTGEVDSGTATVDTNGTALSFSVLLGLSAWL